MSPYMKNSPNRKPEANSTGNGTNTATNQTKRAQAHSTKTLRQNESGRNIGSKSASDGSKEIDDYLKTISRFENGAREGKIGDSELEVTFKALQERMASMTDRKRRRLLGMDFMKNHAIEDPHKLKDSMTELFKNRETREQVFDFLKSRELISLLLDKRDGPETYSPASVIPKGETLSAAKADGRSRANRQESAVG